MAKRRWKIITLIMAVILSLNVFTACDFAQKVVGDAFCLTCMGDQKIKCTSCKGKKETTCGICHGKGRTDCSLCFGTGRRRCSSCGGMGSRYEYDFFTGGYTFKMCYSCAGGYTACVASYLCSCVDGKNTCTKCDEEGQMDCPDCVIVQNICSDEVE